MRKLFVFFYLILIQNFYCQIKNESVISISEYNRILKTVENDLYSNKDSLENYISKISSYLKKDKNSIIQSEANLYLAKLNLEILNVNIAKKHNDIALKLNNNETQLAKIYFLYSKIYMRKSDYATSYSYSLKAIDLANKSNNIDLIQKIYNLLAIVFYQQDKFEKAIKFANISLEYQKKHKNNKNKAYTIGVLGLNYWEIFKTKKSGEAYKKADSLFLKSYSLFIQQKDLHGQGWALSYWSYIFEKKDILKSLKMKLEAEKKWKQCNTDNYATTNNLGNIGLMYAEIADNDSLIKNGNKIPKTRIEILKLAEEYNLRNLKKTKLYNNKYDILLSTKRLSFLQSKKGEFENAYKNLRYSFDLNDSLFSQENKNKIAEIENAKKIAIKNNQIKLKNLTIESNKKQKWYLLSGLLLLTIIGILLYYQSRNRKKSNVKLQLLNNELDEANKAKTRFFSILNHDLRAPVANLVFFLQLQKESPEMLDEESIQRMQDKTMAGAENLLESMEDILQWSKSQMENFKPQPETITMNSIFEDTKKHFSSEEKVKILYENLSNIQITTDENYLKTIIRNLTGNAIKASEGTINPTIIWKTWQDDNLTFLSITDNGKGASEGQFKALYDDKEVVGIKTGLGLHLIRDLAKAIDCEIRVDSKVNEGTTITIIL